MLSEVVSVANRFKRSIRIDTDIGSSSALAGFVCNASADLAISSMCDAIVRYEQRAFTWTGPYGGGKSTLALALATYLGGDSKSSKVAFNALDAAAALLTALPRKAEPWLIVPVVGHKGDPINDIADAFSAADGKATENYNRRKSEDLARRLILELVQEADARSESGVIVIIDEMGKYLEGLSEAGGDLHFFQELAEAAARCKGRLIVLGVLHQSFEQYASRLGKDARDEWGKVQGRYFDVPLVTAVDEVVDLLGQAIEAKDDKRAPQKAALKVAKAVAIRRPSSPSDLVVRLERCWPLHPATALLLGPVSRRRFGQNERSTFAFLNSSEPGAFQEFIQTTEVSASRLYEPADLWNYLRFNLEPAILASPDSHRWSQAMEAIERAETRGTSLHVRLAQTIAMIDLFRGGSGLAPETSVLEACLGNVTKKELASALRDLSNWSVVVYRKHTQSYALYAGSDFDIDDAISEATTAPEQPDLSALNFINGQRSAVAKRHYHQTGTLRWFEVELLPFASLQGDFISNSSAGSSGRFVLVIPRGNDEAVAVRKAVVKASRANASHIVFGILDNSYLLREHGTDLLALETIIRTRPELEGDAVARREVQARRAAAQDEFEQQLQSALDRANWYFRGKLIEPESPEAGLSGLVSDVADRIFTSCPVIHSELINREKPSSSAQGALRLLLYAMIEHPKEQRLAITGYPAEAGLYETVLQLAGLHRKSDDIAHGFFSPRADDGEVEQSFLPMWAAAEEICETSDGIISLQIIFDLWSAEPFGIRKGVLPLLGLSFLLEKKQSLAVYAGGVFATELDRYFADLLLQDARLIGLRPAKLDEHDVDLLCAMHNATQKVLQNEVSKTPLEIARALVGFAFSLPDWTRKTTKLSSEALKVRGILLNAADPYKAIFEELPAALGAQQKPEALGSALQNALKEMSSAYKQMLSRTHDQMLASLDHKGKSLSDLRARAINVSGIGGDLRVDAFAGRLSKMDDPIVDIEGIASLALGKPPRDWSDYDTDRAALSVAELAQGFRQAEIFAGVRGRETTQHAFALAVGTSGSTETKLETILIPDSDKAALAQLTERLRKVLIKEDRKLALAALAEAGASVIDQQ